MSWLSRRMLRKRFEEIGSNVLINYQVEINNEEPLTFPDKTSVIAYLQHYREGNVIFSLKLFRIELYSL